MERETLYINLFGGPSISKSTTGAGVFNLLKLHDIDAEIVTEFAKDLVWEERINTLRDQRYIFGKQYHRIWRLNGKVDIVVTDSPLFLSVIYGKLNSAVQESFYEDVLTAVDEFANFNIILTRTKKYNQNGRIQTEDKAREIDLMIRDSLDEYGHKYIIVPGDYDAPNKIVEIVLEKFDKKVEYKISKI